MHKIAVVTGSRAEYRLLRPTLLRMQGDSSIELQLYVTGSHLSTSIGHTVDEIVADKLAVLATIDIINNDVAPGRQQVARAMATAIEQFTHAFDRHKPDLLLILGDRYEILAVAQAALLSNIPIAHLHGGEITTGAIDDAMRHAITKMANLHLVATKTHRQRVIQLGEQPDDVFVVGAPGLEGLQDKASLSKQQVESALAIRLASPCALITYHPETLSALSAQQQVEQVLLALQRVDSLTCLFTAPNLDVGGDEILARIKHFVSARPEQRFFVASLGERYYLDTVNCVDVVAGNSSSGIIEVPALGVPTVNIGNRQQGRERASTVIDVICDAAAIEDGIRLALEQGRHQQVEHPYQLEQNAAPPSEMILSTIKAWIESGSTVKTFYDLPECARLMAVAS